MRTDDDKVSRRYRELSREEPPPQLDDAILAAARRGVEARPAPLVAPAGRRRWYVPLAAAAIIVLAVAVTVHVERQRPDMEVAEAPARHEPAPAAQDPKPEPPRESRAQRKAEALDDLEKRQVAPAAPARADAAASPQLRAEAQGVMREKAAALEARAPASPEQWLQGIADLRRQGRHEEADKALAEFRRAYPDYRISEAMLEKVEKQP
ncbi:MAG TPA: hypothetical protein VFX94_00920 [Burkholderiales bacterium]|nr:hypothetical protein [Burkholderiales bacterium]